METFLRAAPLVVAGLLTPLMGMLSISTDWNNFKKKMQKEILWHNRSWEEVVKKLDSNIEQGLSGEEVKIRQEKWGKNILPQEKPFSNLKLLGEQFKSPLIYILALAGIIVLAFGQFTDAIVIFGAVFLNTIVGYLQEKKASKALSALKKVVTIQAYVLRDGNTKIVDSAALVSGDIILLKVGSKVPADSRIITAENLKTNEMALTGEWLPARKVANVIDKEIPLADRDNIVFMGTIVEEGSGKAVVVATGLKTQIGQIAQIVKETKEEKTPLQKKLSRLASITAVIIVIASLAIFVGGVIAGRSLLEMFMVAVAVSVAAIPEGLPIAMTVILALGMQRILKRKGLVRKLLAAETLGSTSIIATDKTLTLTEGKMRVSDIITGGEMLDQTQGDHVSALRITAFANEAFIENPEETMKKWQVRGRATDKALLLAAIEAGINKKKLDEQFPQIAELPFDANRKYLASLRSAGKGRQVLYLSGAPERVLALSQFVAIGKKKRKLTARSRKKIETTLEELTRKGLRIVGVGYRNVRTQASSAAALESLCNDLIFVGFIALRDPLRKGVKEAMEICRRAGMRPIIITGDHRLTALSVAREVGFDIQEKHVLEGKDMDQMTDKEFAEIVDDIHVYARMEPRHKMRIIDAWQDRGEVVAMTGDGINDAPALKKADIGIALGSGTEVAKEVSDLVLLDDNFDVIVAAVEEGRSIIDNIRKVITYLLSNSFTETILIGASLFLGLPLPITAAQILWINIIEDGLPDIALAFEPKEKDIMKRKPEGHKISLLTREMKTLIFIIGIVTDILLLGLLIWLFKYTDYDIAHIRSVIFAALAVNSLFYAFSCRSLRRNIWKINPFSNKFLIFAWIFGIAMLLIALYVPLFQTLLKTVPLTIFDWQLVVGLGIVGLVLVEATKFLFIVRKFKP